jgi:hypothetical protein
VSAAVCGVGYPRADGTTILCSYIEGHSANHSWRTLALQDEQDAALKPQYASQVAALLEAIACGDLDPFLEAILAGAHERKRVRRGIWTPGRQA